MLIQKNVDVNIGINTSPLHVAVEKGDLKIVSLLLKAGASVKAVDLYEQTPLELAQK